MAFGGPIKARFLRYIITKAFSAPPRIRKALQTFSGGSLFSARHVLSASAELFR